MNALNLMYIFAQTSVYLSLPPGLLSSICYVETQYKQAAFHVADGSSNSVGVCQVKLSTARGLGFTGTETQLMEPETNVYYAGLYLKYQLTRYRSVDRALVAYNKGNAIGLTSSAYSIKVKERWIWQMKYVNAITRTSNAVSAEALSRR